MKYDIEAIKQQPIRGYLLRMGIEPRREHGSKGMYFSPFRKESEPSFQVDYDKNRWYDFGEGSGGTILDLDMRLNYCSLKDSIERLGNDTIPTIAYIPQPAKPRQSGITILNVCPIESSDLLEYIAGRGISPNVARQYCSEVLYNCGRLQNIRAVGFRNDEGGWELRNACYKHSSSPKTITTVYRGKKRVSVFEGYTDFLSAVELQMIDDSTNVVVLNSVSNIDKSLLFLQHHNEIHLFLDNDKAGRKGVATIQEAMPATRIYDYSYLYEDCNDVNEFLQGKQQSKKE